MPRTKKLDVKAIAHHRRTRPGPRAQMPVHAVITPEYWRAAKELLMLRKAQANLIDYIKYTFPRFKASWHHELLCALLEVVDGRGKKSITFNVGDVECTIQLPAHISRFAAAAPPRHTKTEIISIRRPAWSLGNDCTRMFINVTYGATLALTTSKACKSALKGERAQRIFPIKFDTDGAERWKLQRSAELENGRDSMIASGIMSPLTGEGATDINVDDPFKNKSEAYSKLTREKVSDEYTYSVRTRLQPGGTICVMHTRWHKDDLLGRLLDRAIKDKRADQWTVLVLPATNDSGREAYLWDTATDTKQYIPAYAALWPAWFPREVLDATRYSSSPAFWDAMYQQNPTALEGSIFLRDKWAEFDLEGLLFVDRCVHVWDTAMEDNAENDNDYSAYGELCMADNRYLLTDAMRERLGFPALVAAVYAKYDLAVANRRTPEAVLIENKASGISLIQQIEANNIDPLWRGSRIPVIPMPAILSKEIRALSISGYQNSGLCALPVGDFPSSNSDGDKADFVDELADFPKGTHDDRVDMFVHGMTYYTRPVPGQEHEETLIYGEDYTVNPELDAFDNYRF